jgi:mannitol 2-dehydrogenase
MAVQLCQDNLSRLPSSVGRPNYDRSQLTSGILHIGPSAFFRAHLAVFVDDLLAERQAQGLPLDWGITAVSMKSGDAARALAPQDYLYTVMSKGTKSANLRVVGSVRDIMVASENPKAVLEAAADPSIKAITLTVTQKGYYFSANGFDFEHPDIKACLDEGRDDMSSIGLIVSSLDLRRQRGIAPPTIMSCDNLASNGTTLRDAVLAYARVKSPDLYQWIADNVAFPNNMVDRITPKTTDEHSRLVRDIGVIDAWPIQAEAMPNTAFVIEKAASIDPATGKPVSVPHFHDRAVVEADNVHPYELMKVRTLNGAHMALGCIGHLMGYVHTHEAMKDPSIRAFIKGFMEEAGQTLSPVPGVDMDEYRSDLMDRLDNAQIADQLTRLARNGTDKVSSRFLDSLRQCVSDPDKKHGHLTFALAAWIEYLKRIDGKTGRLEGASEKDEPNDLAAVRLGLTDIVYKGMTNPGPLFSVSGVFGHDMPNNPVIRRDVQERLADIQKYGLAGALKRFVDANTQPGMHVNGHAAEPAVPAYANGHGGIRVAP